MWMETEKERAKYCAKCIRNAEEIVESTRVAKVEPIETYVLIGTQQDEAHCPIVNVFHSKEKAADMFVELVYYFRENEYKNVKQQSVDDKHYNYDEYTTIYTFRHFIDSKCVE